ncbi:MAG: hypothetical protein ACRDPK_04835 [Carbonactinosporaceae bacterium]
MVGAETWEPVMTAAGYRCQCTGACGRTHPKGRGRCETEHTRRHLLIAAPADPTITPTQAAALPASALRAWCRACYDHATRAARQATKAEPPQVDDVFGGAA